MQRLYGHYQEQGVLFLGAFVLSPEKDIREYAEQNGITYPVGRDTGIGNALRSKGIPEVFVIGREGEVVSRQTGAIDFKRLEADIEKALQ